MRRVFAPSELAASLDLAASGGGGGLRRFVAADREARAAAAASRGADRRRQARRSRPSVRTRLLGPAQQSKSSGGSAGAEPRPEGSRPSCSIAPSRSLARSDTTTSARSSSSSRRDSDDPWFLEMNTRLQVEHPVTEAITGFDLVEWQIRIASGERLPARQDEIRESGHAIEARVTAERADQGFRPDAGRIVGYREPPTIRVDSGVSAGSEVTLFYDSLLAKAIGSGGSREIARAKLVAGLRDFAIFGPATTIPFLVDALEHPIFAEGRATTRFIEDAFPDGWAPARPDARLARAAAALLSLAPPTAGSAWTRLSGFRVLGPSGGLSATRLIASEDGRTFRLTVQAAPDGARRVFDDDGEVAIAVRSHGETLRARVGRPRSAWPVRTIPRTGSADARRRGVRRRDRAGGRRRRGDRPRAEPAPARFSPRCRA